MIEVLRTKWIGSLGIRSAARLVDSSWTVVQDVDGTADYTCRGDRAPACRILVVGEGLLRRTEILVVEFYELVALNVVGTSRMRMNHEKDELARGRYRVLFCL